MKNILTAFLWCLFIGFIPLFVDVDIEVYTRDIQFATLSALVYHLINKTKIMERTITLLFFIYFAVESQTYFLYEYTEYTSYIWSYGIFFFISSVVFFYNQFKKYNYRSDKIDSDNIYFCFWPPKNKITLLSTLPGYPFGGLSIYCDGFLYGYRWGSTQYLQEKRDSVAVEKVFYVHDTGIKKNHFIIKELLKLRGKPAGKLRIKCIETIIPVLKLMGPKFIPKSVFRYGPSTYADQVL